MIDFSDSSWISYLDQKVWEYLPSGSLKTKSSTEITFRCPFCGDSRKNPYKKRGYFYRKDGTFHCFNCEEHGSGLKLLKLLCSKEVYDQILQDYKVLNFNRVVGGGGGKKEKMAEFSNSAPFELLAPDPSYRYLMERGGWGNPEPLSPEANAYLDGRRIPLDRRNMLRTIRDLKGRREFILVQYLWDDRCIYHQLDNFNRYDLAGQGPVKYVFPKDENINLQQKPVFNLDSVDVSFPYLFCTEGIYDSLFIKNGVALGGRNLTDYQFTMLKKLYPRHKVVLAFDNDRAGLESSLKHAEKMDVLFLDIYGLFDAAKVKDLNDFVKATGRTDIFTNPAILRKLTMTPFKAKMNLMLH